MGDEITSTGSSPGWSQAQRIDRSTLSNQEEIDFLNGLENRDIDPNNPLSRANFEALRVMNTTLKLLVDLTTVLEKTAIVKADKIRNLLTPLKESITDRIGKTVILTQGMGSKTIKGPEQATRREEINRIQSQRTEKYKAQGSQIDSTIKMQMNEIDSAQNSINQTKSMFNSFMQWVSDRQRAIR